MSRAAAQTGEAAARRAGSRRRAAGVVQLVARWWDAVAVQRRRRGAAAEAGRAGGGRRAGARGRRAAAQTTARSRARAREEQAWCRRCSGRGESRLLALGRPCCSLHKRSGWCLRPPRAPRSPSAAVCRGGGGARDPAPSPDRIVKAAPTPLTLQPARPSDRHPEATPARPPPSPKYE